MAAAEVVALGELLIDLVAAESGVGLAQSQAFQKAAGGAPANVAVGVARLGRSAAFFGKVGDDPFGHFLAETLGHNGVDVAGLRFDEAARTALAFVSLRGDGEREFLFFRHPSADMRYRPDEVDTVRLRAARILHVGSISLIDEPSRSATLHALTVAREGGLLLSYDPNLRLSLWPSEDAAREGIRRAWPLADLIKVSEEELCFLSGCEQPTEGARRLWHERLRLLVVTRGAGGCLFFTPEGDGAVPAFPVAQVDTTGAGDGFVAGLLVGLLRDPAALHEAERLATCCRYANAVGALTTTQRGAIPALPTAATVAAFMARHAPT